MRVCCQASHGLLDKRIQSCILNDAPFSGASLNGASLGGASLGGASLGGASLSGAPAQWRMVALLRCQ
ncbi:MAG: pentapeptide repeat-containing protein [Hyphomicrobiaceae bacterium]